MKSRNSPLHAKIKAALVGTDNLLNRELAKRIGVPNPVCMGAVRYLVHRGELSEHPTPGKTRATLYSLPSKKEPVRTGYKAIVAEYDDVPMGPVGATYPTQNSPDPKPEVSISASIIEDWRMLIIIGGTPTLVGREIARRMYNMLHVYFGAEGK